MEAQVNVFKIVAQSAIETLLILDRQGRKDFGKVARFGFVRIEWLLETLVVIVAALVGRLDRWIESHEVRPVSWAAIDQMVDEMLSEVCSIEVLDELQLDQYLADDREFEPVAAATEPLPEDMSDEELIRLAKQLRIDRARKMGYSRRLSAATRAALVQEVRAAG